LTPDIGHPKLREYMASVVTAMKLSSNYEDFKDKLDMLHPRYGETAKLLLGGDKVDGDDGQGL
jgi:hypothetical protein